MPISPENRKRYPTDWLEIRAAILERAGNQCEGSPAYPTTREEAIEKYRAWISARPELQARVRRELRGKILGCWCAPLPCHGDLLLEIANGVGEGRRLANCSLLRDVVG